MKKSTIKDVAALSGYSIATVSRVINGKDKVSPEVADRINQAIKELNYYPNQAARSMRQTGRKVIGLILPNTNDPYFGSIANYIVENAALNGLNVLLSVAKSQTAYDEIACFNQLLNASVDGLIYCSISPMNNELFESHFHGIPAVVCSRHHQLPRRSHVYFDHLTGGYLATRHLIDMGHSRIAIFVGVFGYPFSTEQDLDPFLQDHSLAGAYSGVDKYIGFRQALEEKGVPFYPELLEFIDLGDPYQSGFQAMQRLISKTTDFDAVFCSNDFSATGALHMLNLQKISVPEAVSVVGYDDSFLATCAQPKLTSVFQDTSRLGYECIQALLKAMSGEPAENTVIDVNLIVRESSCRHVPG